MHLARFLQRGCNLNYNIHIHICGNSSLYKIPGNINIKFHLYEHS